MTTAHTTTVVPMGERIRRAARADLTSQRSTPTVWVLLAGSAVMAVISASANLAVLPADELASAATAQLIMHASTVATLVFAAVAGAVSATSDIRFGRLDQALMSEPSRSMLLMAKGLVASAVGLIYGVVGAVVALATLTATLAIRGATVDVGRPEVVSALVGVIPGAALFGLAGMAIGLVIRNQSGAVAGVLAHLLIVEPTTLLGLPRVGRWFPGAAGLALTNSPDENLLSQGTGALVLFTYTVLFVALAAHRFKSADL